MKYYPALDGLRAIAVGLVLLFHGTYGHVPGGFLGVDAFFVLSGYLITRVLVEKHELRFSEFYARRARRLLPALGVALVIAAATWRKTTPGYGFGFAALSVALYVSNFVAILHPRELGPLLHTWSLATEEQFYLVWPVCLWLLFRLTPQRRLRPVLVAIALTAVVKALLHVSGSRVADYFSPFCRVDQLLVGGALALAADSVRAMRAHLQRIAALCLLSLPVLALTVSKEMDGYYVGGMTLFALCTATVIAVAVDETPTRVRTALSFPPLVAVGRVSYGIYLFHMPIFAVLEFLRVAHSPVNFAWVSALKLGLTGVAAYLSYTLVEQPVLRWKRRA